MLWIRVIVFRLKVPEMPEAEERISFWVLRRKAGENPLLAKHGMEQAKNKDNNRYNMLRCLFMLRHLCWIAGAGVRLTKLPARAGMCLFE